MDNTQLSLVFGDQALLGLSNRKAIEAEIDRLYRENEALLQQAQNAFHVDLTLADIIVAAAAGVVCGAISGCFKSFVPQEGKFKHKHGTRRTAIDHKVPKPEGMHGSVQGLHRQIGPGHDLGRFKEALDLMSGETNDFPLWGKNISDYTGGVLHSGNIKLDRFLETGGFKIPADPKAELINHLVIDFFTKTSLPIPFSSYLADNSEFMGKLMISMYGNGLNLKNLVGSLSSVAVIQLITHSYAFLFKALSSSDFVNRIKQASDVEDFKSTIELLSDEYKLYIESKEFHVIQMIAHGASFLVDTTITAASQNYTGILSLDYGSLLILGSSSIKYMSSGMADYRTAMEGVAKINHSLETANQKWFSSFKHDVLILAQSDNFNQTFSPNLIIQKHESVMSVLEQGEEKKKSLRQELQEWNIDETV